MKKLIIIPTYNEVNNITPLIDEINGMDKLSDFSVLIVDDSSNDGTLDEITKLFEKYKNIYILKRKEKLGLASAYIDGFKYGLRLGFDCFIQMDADFSHNPKYLPLIFKALKSNDVVIGSRYVKGGKVENWSIIRYLVSKCGSFYAKTILKCPINDLTGGFNAWKKDIIDKIKLDEIISKGYCFQIEMKYKAFKNNAKILEIPIVFKDRKFGKSKMSKTIFFEALLNVIKIKFNS